MTLWSPHQFATAATDRLDAAAVQAAIEAAHATQARGLPAILTLNHLAVHTGLTYKYLRHIVERQYDPYRAFEMQKRGGGYRLICVPERSLMLVQRWIARYMLQNIAAHHCSFAYQLKKSIAQCASLHLGANWLVKVDARQFFESISEKQVYEVFRSVDYASLVSMEMARITTRLIPPRSSRARDSYWQVEQRQRYSIPWYSADRLGALPQGAPTSPMLSNLAMREFDAAVEGEAKSLGWLYTRYSDDLIFSTRGAHVKRSDAEQLIEVIYRRMNSQGLRPHQAKTVIAPPGARKIVLGLLVDGDRVRLTKDFRKSLECHAHYIRMLGPVAHAQHRKFLSVSGMKAHIYGLIAFAESIDGVFSSQIRQSLSGVLWPT